MAEKLLGKKLVLMLNSKIFGCSTDIGLSISTTSVNTTGTCRGDLEEEAAGGNGLTPTSTTQTGYSYTVTPGALFRFPTTAAEVPTIVTIPQLQKLMLTGAKLPFSFEYEDEASGYKATYSGTVVITESTLNAPLDGYADGSFTFTGDGPLVITEVLPE